MKYTINEFAKEIRKLYPGDYDDLSDEKLVELWLKKYPADYQKVNLKSTNSPLIPFKSKFRFKYLLYALILIFAFLTNPSLYEHKEAIIDEVLIPTVDKLGENLGINDLSATTFLGIDLTRTGLKSLLDNPGMVKYNDYLIFSTANLEDETVSFGIFSFVYIPPRVKKEVEKYINGMN